MSGNTERLNTALAGRYKIEKQLGQGGMATVYLAKDIKHDRLVAVKVLKPELAAVLGADRFVVEIKTTASLQHPHILPLFDSGTADGFLYYVMPYIEGETLRDKLRRETQFGIDEAVRITTQVADALDYAHRHGVIHRDIKPENILLHDGRPMVADFGIALAVSAAAGGRMTETGLSLGTPHYMSPEQATADKDITARSDIYSLASVLYEMLSGQPPHMGNSAQMIIMRIIAEPVESVTKLRKSVPANVADALAKALEKLPADRFDSAKAFADALGNTTFSTSAVSGHGSRVTGHGRSVFGLPFIGASAVAALFAILYAKSAMQRPNEDPPPMLARLTSGPTDSIDGSRSNAGRPNRTAIAISPDGSTLVFVGRRNGVRQLLSRPLGGETATPITGTEGGESPFFSPNGLHLGFYSRGALKRVPLAGGPATEIAKVSRVTGASWSDDDHIAVGTELDGIVVYSATGTTPPDTILGAETLLPQYLPGSKALLFSDRSLSPGLPDMRVGVFDIKTRERTILVTDGADPRYVPTGHLVFGRGGALLAVPFDVHSLSIAGSPVVVLSDVMQAFNGNNASDITGAAQVAISPLGHLVHLTGGVTPDRASPLMWLDRQGRETPIPAAGNRPYFAVRLSPDDRQAVASSMGKVAGIHVIDFSQGSVNTLGARSFQLWPLWSQDGKRVVHHANVRDSASLGWSVADGSRPEAALVADKVILGDPVFWSMDGKKLYTSARWGDSTCLYEVDMSTGASKPVPDLPPDCGDPTISPNGRWIMYSAEDQAGTSNVFVQPWPTLDRKWNVSVTRGSNPIWVRNGREIVYTVFLAADSLGDAPLRMMSVAIGSGSDFTFEPARPLFTAVFGNSTSLRAFDVTQDGSRFLVARGARVRSPAGEPRIIVNWFTQLRRLSAQQGSK